MKLKEFFERVEEINKVLAMVGKEELVVEFDVDGEYGSFKSYVEFIKYLSAEWAKMFAFELEHFEFEDCGKEIGARLVLEDRILNTKDEYKVHFEIK